MEKCKKLIAIGLAASFLSLFGCTKGENRFKPSDRAKITSISIFESQMDYSHCYHFYIREEDDGTVLFSGEFQPSDNSKRIVFEDFEIDKSYMDELRRIAEDNGTLDYFKSYRNRKMKVSALDAPSYSSSITMSDGSHKTADFLCDGSSEFKIFFTEIAEKYKNEITTKPTTAE